MGGDDAAGLRVLLTDEFVTFHERNDALFGGHDRFLCARPHVIRVGLKTS